MEPLRPINDVKPIEPNSFVLRFPIANFCLSELTQIAMRSLETSHCLTVVCMNAHSAIIARSDHEFSTAVQSAEIVLPDGISVVMASRLYGGEITSRVTGPDFFYQLMAQLNLEKPVRVFFLGSTSETLQKIERRFAEDYPALEWAGSYSPPFKDDFSDADSEEMINSVNKCRPDVLWVGMTAPKQEKWIHSNRERLDVAVVGAVGAVFDYYAGNNGRDYYLLSKIGIPNENFFSRFLENPRKMWRRFFVSHTLFLLILIFEWLISLTHSASVNKRS